MDPAIRDYMLLAIAALSATTVGFAAAWLRARERAIRAEARRESFPERLAPDAGARFDRLDQAVEAMAVELERIGEAERFQSKLLASRGAPRAEPERSGPGRVVTPH